MKQRLGKKRGKVCAALAAAALFVSTVGVQTASAGGYGHKYHYGYGHHGHSVGFGYSKYPGYGHHKRGYHGGGRSYAAIIVPTIAIGVGALLYLDHKRKKHGHGHHHHVHHHHHHQGCQSEYSSCGGTPTAPQAAQRPGSTGTIDDRLAGGPNVARAYPSAPPPIQQRSTADSPLVASNAPCKPVTQKKRGPDGYMLTYQAMLCYHTNGTAFIQPGSLVPIGPQ